MIRLFGFTFTLVFGLGFSQAEARYLEDDPLGLVDGASLTLSKIYTIRSLSISNILIKTIIIITNNTHKNNKNYNTNNK